MGVDTKGIVTNAVQIDLFSAASTLEKALKPFTWNPLINRRGAGTVSVEILTWTKALSVVFQVKNPEEGKDPLKRRLMVFFNCQSDHPEYGPEHVSLLIGCWGESVDIMTAATTALANLAGGSAKAYLLENDSLSSDYKEVVAAQAA